MVPVHATFNVVLKALILHHLNDHGRIHGARLLLQWERLTILDQT